jgi:hypothetical protein
MLALHCDKVRKVLDSKQIKGLNFCNSTFIEGKIPACLCPGFVFIIERFSNVLNNRIEINITSLSKQKI